MEQEIRALELPEWEILPDIGLYMDQVVTLMDRTFSPTLPKGEMTKSMVNNYVKVGMIPRPTGKKYDRDHLAMLIMIGVLKQALSMESISRLLEVICQDGIREGYDRFRMMTESIDQSAKVGRVELQGSGESAGEQALRSGIMAALCTIRTCRLLEADKRMNA